MKRVGILALFVIALPGIAQVPLIPPPDTDPFVGTWLKNRDKSQPITNGAYVLVESYHSETISREGDDLVVSTRRGPSEWSPGGFETGMAGEVGLGQ